jgi:hypothetical protein
MFAYLINRSTHEIRKTVSGCSEQLEVWNLFSLFLVEVHFLQPLRFQSDRCLKRFSTISLYTL